MSRNTKAKKAKKAKLRKQIAKRVQGVSPGGSPPAQASQVKNLKPRPGTGEREEDLAVFSRTHREQLAEDLQLQAELVSQALDLVQHGDDEQAASLLKNIARSSPFSEWRLFVRGLSAFYRGQSDEASQSWLRLDGARRPARIAAVLWPADSGIPLYADRPAPPNKLVSTAKELLKRSMVLEAAKRIAAVRHRDPGANFSASQVALLRDFRDDYRNVAGQFVAEFSQACVLLSTQQGNPEIFELLKKTVPGPAHDPSWNLQSFLYASGFSNTDDLVEQFCDAYVKNDLNRLTHLPANLVAALGSRVRMLQAARVLDLGSNPLLPFGFQVSDVDFKTVEALLRESVKCFPKNREAHVALLSTLLQQTESVYQTKPKIAAIEKRIVAAKAAFVKVFPDEVELTLELVDHYFDEDQVASAQALIKQLGDQRLDSPLSKALPWKVKLRQAMLLSRRKTSLDTARKSLTDAACIWPSWLGSDWVPYLQAAIEFREGNCQAIEASIAQSRGDQGLSEIVTDFMAFAALQQMSVAGAELKPFREKVDAHLRNLKQSELKDVLQLASFMWDLRRTGMLYKAYRLHAGKIGKQLCSLFKSQEVAVVDTDFLNACSWIGSHHFWNQSYGGNVPSWAQQHTQAQAQVAAAVLDCLCNSNYWRYRIREYPQAIEFLEAAARSEKDPFHRHRFATIAKKASQLFADLAAKQGQRTSSYDDLEEYEDEVDEPCNCADCRRRRARENSTRTRPARRSANPPGSRTPTLFDLEEEAEVDDGFDFENEDPSASMDGLALDKLPPELLATLVALGPQGLADLATFFQRNADDVESPKFQSRLKRFLTGKGFSSAEADQFIRACLSLENG